MKSYLKILFSYKVGDKATLTSNVGQIEAGETVQVIGNDISLERPLHFTLVKSSKNRKEEASPLQLEKKILTMEEVTDTLDSLKKYTLLFKEYESIMKKSKKTEIDNDKLKAVTMIKMMREEKGDQAIADIVEIFTGIKIEKILEERQDDELITSDKRHYQFELDRDNSNVDFFDDIENAAEIIRQPPRPTQASPRTRPRASQPSPTSTITFRG